jgi:D-sedoheptulose 7-phosphate isomerase
VGRFQKERSPLAAIALTTDTSAITAIGNDYGFEKVFSRQVDGLATYSKDVLIAISTSGESANVIEAAEAARMNGCAVIGLLGKGGGMAPLCDVALIVPSDNTARIQEAHIFLGHMLCQLTEEYLGTE